MEDSGYTIHDLNNLTSDKFPYNEVLDGINAVEFNNTHNDTHGQQDQESVAVQTLLRSWGFSDEFCVKITCKYAIQL